MKSKTIISCHDELLSNLIMINEKNKVIEDNDDNNYAVIKDQNTMMTLFKLFSENSNYMYSLSSQEIIIYIILLDNYLKDPADYKEITIKEIHSKYRGKRVGKTELLDYSTRKAYEQAIKRLHMRQIIVATNNVRKKYKMNNKYSRQYLLEVKDIENFDNGDVKFEYSLGIFGEILLKSKRYSESVPIEVFRKSFRQIPYVLIGMYISRIIYINSQKKEKSFEIKLTSIMNRINYYKKDGSNSGLSHLDMLQSSVQSKYFILSNFLKNLMDILEVLYKNQRIQGYELIPNDEASNISIKNYEEIRVKIKI